MLKKLENSWQLVKASARVLSTDTELLIFPAISGLALILVSASFFLPMAFLGSGISNLAQGGIGVVGFAVLFLFYVSQYFIIIFFNAALIGAASIRLNGGDPTLSDGLRMAWSRVGSIFGYALIAATVGMILKAMRERGGWLSKIVLSMVGMAWNLATFLVVPVLVSRDLGPVEAIQESARTLKRTWGEQIAGNLGLGFVFILLNVALALVAVPVMILAVGSGQVALIVMAAVIFGGSFLVLNLVQSALAGIYQAALYRFATTGEAGWGFEQSTLRSAFVAA